MEVSFKDIKQYLDLKSFIGISKNDDIIQFLTTLIIYLYKSLNT